MGERLNKFLSLFRGNPEQPEKKAETQQLIQQVRTAIETGRVSELDTTQMAEAGASLEVLKLVRKAQDDEKIQQTKALIAAGKADELDPARMAADGFPVTAIKLARKAQQKIAKEGDKQTVQAVKEIIKAGQADELDVAQMVASGMPLAAVKKARIAQAGRGKVAKAAIAVIKAPAKIGARIARPESFGLDSMPDDELFRQIEEDVESASKPLVIKKKKGEEESDEEDTKDDKDTKDEGGEKTKKRPVPRQEPDKTDEKFQFFAEYLSNPDHLILKSRLGKLGALYKLLGLSLTQDGRQSGLLEYLGFTRETITKYIQVIFGSCGNEALKTAEGVEALIEQDETAGRLFGETIFASVLQLEGKSDNSIETQCERLDKQMQRLPQIFQLRDIKDICRIINVIKKQEGEGKKPTFRQQLDIVREEGRCYEKDDRGNVREFVDADGLKKVVTIEDRERALSQDLAEIEKALATS